MTLQYRRQPAKTIYLLYELLCTIFVKIPFWIVLAIPRGWRPVPSRSFKRTMAIHLFRHLVDSLDKVGLNEPNHENLQGEDGVWVNPKPNLIVGDLKTWASVSSVEPVRIPGYFYFPQRSSNASSQKVIYSLHGGSYVMGSAHPSAVNANIPRALLEDAESAVKCVFALEYRLSKSYPLEPANPFPAALIDAISGYDFLISEQGILPSDIIVEGDSAGGNLALALTRYLVENRIPGLPPPGGLLLLSPWCDVGTSHDVHPSSIRILKADIDTEPQRGMDYAKAAFLGPHGMGAADLNLYISPASLHPSMTASFKGFPKTFICAGETENLLPQVRLLRDRMVRDLGKRSVGYFEGQDEPHDYLVLPWLSVTREETLQEIAQWIMHDVQ
ncbi:hypothetical protein Moror_6377 [Moniliophthora roreri MCA 2997]|uniref:Alpha/beta hydrolase fold-3 domain-containing protein n=1 Tax=Moniliophthora roreri (strain MCA 2997) TaxID=1381753 RepID=V2XWE0_MONRO|nr:hypothetical protein Moror_6377 [Moniliophthora roreri MCA 2997]